MVSGANSISRAPTPATPDWRAAFTAAADRVVALFESAPLLDGSQCFIPYDDYLFGSQQTLLQLYDEAIEQTEQPFWTGGIDDIAPLALPRPRAEKTAQTASAPLAFRTPR